MLESWVEKMFFVKQALCWRCLGIGFFAALFCQVSTADRLWVSNPEEIYFAIGAMTSQAQIMGLSDADFAATIHTTLHREGFRARLSNSRRGSDLLFLDIVVEDESYYASLEFRRKASYALPDGKLNSEFVTVWQDYAIGAHHDDPAPIRATVGRILERFVAEYNEVNSAAKRLRVMSTP